VGVVLPQPIRFGKYTLFERIGRGGMADVFKARVQGRGGYERIFAVKRILPHLLDDPRFTRMFIEEAKLSARLDHPNIVRVLELGAVDAEDFIAMEYVQGRDLGETMRTFWARVGPPRPELVAYIGREMCRGLAYAHDLVGGNGEPLGVIHGDVSPSNVMLSYEGAVKLLDFGIARALNSDTEEDGIQRDLLKGKFAYMAPEQTQGNDVDRRIDIFATGIVLHEILTGLRLFKGENDLRTIGRVRQCDVAPPSQQNPLCPPELDAIVLRALARSRDGRFQTASEMADALDGIVRAARFHPRHLATLMRDLFPPEPRDDDDPTSTVAVKGLHLDLPYEIDARTGRRTSALAEAFIDTPTPTVVASSSDGRGTIAAPLSPRTDTPVPTVVAPWSEVLGPIPAPPPSTPPLAATPPPPGHHTHPQPAWPPLARHVPTPRLLLRIDHAHPAWLASSGMVAATALGVALLRADNLFLRLVTGGALLVLTAALGISASRTRQHDGRGHPTVPSRSPTASRPRRRLRPDDQRRNRAHHEADTDPQGQMDPAWKA
jgi:serine/threonine protein kinase